MLVGRPMHRHNFDGGAGVKQLSGSGGKSVNALVALERNGR